MIKTYSTWLLWVCTTIAAWAQPANDTWSAATNVTSLIGTCSSAAAYTTVGATADQQKGSCWANGPSYNVWFRFTATSTGYIKVQVNVGGTEGTLQYAMVAIWSSATTQLNCQAHQGATSDIETDYYGLTAGQTYYISVDNYADPGYRGTFSLCLSDVPDYNFAEGARDVTSLINQCSANAIYTTVNATADRSKGACWTNNSTTANYNRWFKFTATTTRYIKVQVKTGGAEGTMQHPLVALWSASFAPLACQDRWGATVDIETDYYGLTAGQTYYISVDNYADPSYRGTFSLCLSDVTEYNFVEGAKSISGSTAWCSANAAYTTEFASADRNRGSCATTGPSYNRWFKFVATGNAAFIQLKTGGVEGTLQYPYLALWAADATTPLACAAYSSPTSDISITYTALTAGTSYYISVDNYADPSDQGTFTLCLENTTVPLPLTFLSFTASPQTAGVRLHWTTAAEHDNDYFRIERSWDGHAFEVIGHVAGLNKNVLNVYDWLDADAVDVLRRYYRLTQVDIDGAVSYSPLVMVLLEKRVDEELSLVPYPNPAHDVVALELADNYTLFDVCGRQVMAVQDTHYMEVSGLPPGLYTLRNSQGRSARLVVE